jgi:large subunit ribosomal protein L15
MAEIGLHNLSPAAGARRNRRRIGRGGGSGDGRTATRGQKGQKARSGSHRMRAGFEGGQMPLYMRLGKLRGPHMKKSMPFEPFRTHNETVNLDDLAARFAADSDVTPQALVSAGLLKNTRGVLKILGRGELAIPLRVAAHRFSKTAQQKIEQAGGSVVVLEVKTPPSPQ